MGGAPLALAFTAGMLATVNPCGFAMLPAYLSYFVGIDRSDRSDSADGSENGAAGAGRSRSVGRALAVALVMTLGFVAVFGVVGLIIVQVSSRVQQHLPWVTMAVGVLVIGLGVAALFGHNVTVRLPHVQGGTSGRELTSMLLFGMSYALSSLSCTIAPFLATTSSTFDNGGVLAGVATFVAYGVGMGAIVALLTLAVALARDGVVLRFRRLMRHVHTLSGVLLVVAGAYLTYYAWYEVRLRSGVVDDPIVDRALAVQQWLSEQVGRVGELRIGMVAAVAVAAALVSVGGWRRTHRGDADRREG